MTASDGRNPPKMSNATVTVNIIRDESSPAFINVPYTDATVSENEAIGTEFYTKVQANDPDIQGEMVYEAVGDVPAPSFFAIDRSTGAISVKANLKEDDDFEYIVSNLTHRISSTMLFFSSCELLHMTALTQDRRPPVWSPSPSLAMRMDQYLTAPSASCPSQNPLNSERLSSK